MDATSPADRETLESRIAKLKIDASKCKDKRAKASLNGEIAVLEDQLDKLEPTPSSTNTNDNDSSSGNFKVSKARRKREDKAKVNAERQRAIEKESEEAARTSSRRVERDQLTSLLSERGLRLIEIEPNGDCLYSSVIHQSKLKKVSSIQVDERLRNGSSSATTGSLSKADDVDSEAVFELSVKKLRAACASYMLDNADDYMPFVETDDGEPCDIDRFQTYCARIVDEPVWATHLEIGALSHLLRRSIHVVQYESPNEIIIGETYENDDNNPLYITFERHAYTLGEHFNSTEPL